MKHLLNMIVLCCFIATTVGCSKSDENEPYIPNHQTEPTIPLYTHVDGFDFDQEFIPYSGPVEPVTDAIRPVYTQGKRWIIQYVSSDTVWSELQVGRVLDESTNQIDNLIAVEYTTVEYSAHKVPSWEKDPSMTSYYREENGKIYERRQSPYEEIYDEIFNIDPDGPTIYGFEDDPQIYIVSKGTITLMGKQRRAVKVRNRVNKFDYWVEGIGRLFNLTPNYTSIRPCSTTASEPTYPRMLQCFDGDEKIYDYREFSDDLYIPSVVF